MPAAHVLIVDDEALLRWSLKQRLQSSGHDVVEAGSVSEAFERISPDTDLVLLDFRLPDGDGLQILPRIKERAPDAPVIMMTAYSTIENAVEAMKCGAYHYVNKPFHLEEIDVLVAQALETSRLRREVR